MSISPQLLRQKLDIVPLSIRERMGLDETVDTILGIKKSYAVPPNDPLVAQLILSLMIEILKPQYFAWQLKEGLKLTPEAAKRMSAEIRTKVLDPVKADFKKIGIDIALVGNLEEPLVQPAMPPAPRPMEGSMPLPKPASLDAIAPKPATPVPAPMAMPAAPAMPKAPSPFVAAAAPLPVNRAAAPVPAAAATPKNMPGAAAPLPTAPAPFMLHQEASAAPLAPGGGFKLNISSDMFRSTAPAKRIDVPLPPKAAELEIGKASSAPKPQAGPITTATGSGRVVHYSDFRTMVAPGFVSATSTPASPVAAPKPATPVPAPMAMPAAPAMPKAPSPFVAAAAPLPVNRAAAPVPAAAATPKNMPGAAAPLPTAPAPTASAPRPPMPPPKMPTPPAAMRSPAPAPLPDQTPMAIPIMPAPFPGASQAQGQSPAASNPPQAQPRVVPKVVNFGPEEVK